MWVGAAVACCVSFALGYCFKLRVHETLRRPRDTRELKHSVDRWERSHPTREDSQL